MSELLIRLNGFLPLEMTVDFFFRVFIACLCGAVVGIERSKRFKEAGIRTHSMVACAAAAFMILSKYCFADLAVDSIGTPFAGDRGADPARIAAQVVSGLGFLGAGVIFKTGNSIKGLTTAAGLWATAAIGMAIGSGMYLFGVFVTVVLVILQLLTHRFAIGNDAYSTSKLILVAKSTDGVYDWIKEQFGSDMQIIDSSIARNKNDTITYRLTIRAPKNLEFTHMLQLLEETGKDNIVSVAVSGE